MQNAPFPEETVKPSEVRRHFDHLAKLYDKFKKKNWYYYAHLKRFLSENVPPGARVLEVGCGTGELLNHVRPREGYGIDLSGRMIERARRKFPHLNFVVGEAEQFAINEKFDSVLMIDVLDHVYDIWDLLKGINAQA
jgi:ubiquinone/menaquinone biosynthesis C-methylase UbiE